MISHRLRWGPLPSGGDGRIVQHVRDGARRVKGNDNTLVTTYTAHDTLDLWSVIQSQTGNKCKYIELDKQRTLRRPRYLFLGNTKIDGKFIHNISIF